jgi:hypothetical protein
MSWRSQLYPPSILDWGGVRDPMSEQELEVCLRSPGIAQEKCLFKCSLDLFIVIACLKLIPDSMMVLDADLLGVLIISLPETLGGKNWTQVLEHCSQVSHRWISDQALAKPAQLMSKRIHGTGVQVRFTRSSTDFNTLYSTIHNFRSCMFIVHCVAMHFG